MDDIKMTTDGCLGIPLEVGECLTPIIFPLVLPCYRAKFAGSAATSPLVELLTENFLPFPVELGGPKFNHF